MANNIVEQTYPVILRFLCRPGICGMTSPDRGLPGHSAILSYQMRREKWGSDTTYRTFKTETTAVGRPLSRISEQEKEMSKENKEFVLKINKVDPKRETFRCRACKTSGSRHNGIKFAEIMRCMFYRCNQAQTWKSMPRFYTVLSSSSSDVT